MSAYALPITKPAFTQVLTRNLDEIPGRTWGWDAEFYQLSRGLLRGEYRVLELPGLQLHWTSYDRVVKIQGTAPPGTLAFGLDFVSEGSIRFCGHQAISRGDIILAHPAQDPFSLVTANRHDYGVVLLDLDTFNNSGCTLYHQELWNILQGNQALRAQPGHLIRIKALIKNIFEQLATSPEAILERPRVQKAITQELTEGMLALICSKESLIPEKVSPGFRREAVGRALEYIQSNLDKPLSLVDICEAAGASSRTLLYGFRDMTGLSPKAYLKARRLNEVRRDLLNGAAPTVGEIADRWGFWHLNHFGRDYKAMFGELPSETLAGKEPVRNIS
jgi:AraC family ethanolamine operon transcriptional activator